jgi:8-oxo-dGTP diphosphatase
VGNQITVVVKGIIICRRKVLIVKRDDDDPIGPGTWEFAGGCIEFGETLEEAMIREAHEEAGIGITIKKLLYAHSFKTKPSRQIVMITYLCDTDQQDVTLSDEHAEFLWADMYTARALLLDAIVKDMEKYNVFESIAQYIQ